MLDFYFRDIEISNLEKILEEFKKSLDFNLYTEPFTYVDVGLFDSCENFLFWCNENKLSINKIAVVVSDHKSNNALPHIDSQENLLALNFPIENCQDTYTELYKIPEKYIEVVREKHGVLSKSIISKNFGHCVARYQLSNAVLINTHQPHKIICNHENRRICLSFRFIEDPWHLINETNTVLTD